MKKKIKVLEDDQDIRELVVYLLESAGYDVEASASIDDFNATLVDRSVPDVFLLDIMLPDGSGLDLCVALKSNAATTAVPVVMMSAHAQEQTVSSLCKADMFISKPFDIDDFIGRLAQIA